MLCRAVRPVEEKLGALVGDNARGNLVEALRTRGNDVGTAGEEPSQRLFVQFGDGGKPAGVDHRATWGSWHTAAPS